jgi:coatomer subunit zeta
MQETFPLVKNILLLDSEGKRVAVKYYSDGWPTLSAKLAFEKSVFAKTQKANAGTDGNLHLISLNTEELFSTDGERCCAPLR